MNSHATSILSSLAIALLLATASARGDRLRNVEHGQEVPPFTVRTLAGTDLDSASLRGKVVVIVYIAAEQRSSEGAALAAARIERELGDEGVTVVFLTADVTRIEHFRQMRERLELRAPLGLDVARRVYGELGLIVLPTTIVVDRAGGLARVIASFTPDYEHVLRSSVRHALGLIDDAELELELTPGALQRDRPEDRIARRRAVARLLRGSGLLDDAEKELHAALEIGPADADTLLDLASLEIERECIDDAAELVARVLTADPAHRRGKLLEGVVLYHRGDLDAAERSLERALLLNPDPVWTHYYLGLVRERRGDAPGAAAHFKESLRRLLPDHPM